MRIAVISDIHGNKNALDSVLDDIRKQSVDQIVCAGDFIDPLPESKVVWEQLKSLKVPLIRGNHEDYIITVHNDPSAAQSTDENWKPVRATAKLFTKSDCDELGKLPLKIFFEEVNALICHASPSSNKKGWIRGIDEELAGELASQVADFIVCGHWHAIREELWHGKMLVIVGSVGVPLHGKQEAEYAIIEKRNGNWKVENRFIPYDYEGTAKKYVDSGFVADAAPISWLLLDEIRTGERRISPFMTWRNSSKDFQQRPWKDLAEEYFCKIGRWEELKKAAKL